jgi:hypothetical protein
LKPFSANHTAVEVLSDDSRARRDGLERKLDFATMLLM